MVGGISCFAMGPSRLLGFGENLSLLLVGQGISGFAISLIFVPLETISAHKNLHQPVIECGFCQCSLLNKRNDLYK